MEKKMDLKRIVTIAIMTIGLIAYGQLCAGCDEGDDSGDCAGDCDTDGDTDGDTDSDTDGDTDSDTDTQVDPTACDCLNGMSDAEGCVDIEGEWYRNDYGCCVPNHLMTVTLTTLEVNCKIEFSGDTFLFLPFEDTQLPTEFYFEEENVTLQLFMEAEMLVQKKIYESSGDDGFVRYKRCDC